MKKEIALLDLGGVTFQSTGRTTAHIHWDVITPLNYKYGHALNVGEDLFPTFLKEYNQLTDQQLSGTEFLKSIFDLLDFNATLLEGLRPHFKIVIVSENYRENIAYISQRYRFADWAMRQIYSVDYQLVKADDDFFPKVFHDLKDWHPEQLFLVDDSPDKLASAAHCGIEGILYKTTEQALAEVRRRFVI